MKKIVEQNPLREAEKILEILEGLGFNTQLLCSINYVLKTLQALNEDRLAKIRETLATQRHPRFLKTFSNDLPFGTKNSYRKEIAKARLDKLAGLMKIWGFLMQTKVYLFWNGSFGNS